MSAIGIVFLLNSALTSTGAEAGVSTSTGAESADAISEQRSDLVTAPSLDETLDPEAPRGKRFGIARTLLRLDARFAMHTRFPEPANQAAEFWLGGRFEIDVSIAEDLSAFVAPNFSFVSALNKDGSDREFLYFVTPEARVQYAFGPFDLRVGALLFNWGSSDLVAPCDVLNPYDYRRSFFATSADAKIPVLAAELVTHAGPLTVRGVVEPFFTPSRFFLTGWDTALIQPGLMTNFNVASLQSLLGASTLDDIGDKFLVTHRPSDRPDNATLGIRATLALGRLDVSATGVHGWEPLPQITVNPDLAYLTGQLANSVAGSQQINTLDPQFLASLARLQDALARGEKVFDSVYTRRDLIGFDSTLALDPFVLKIDVAYTFARTSYTQDYKPVTNPWLNAVIGLEYLAGDDLQIIVESFTLTLFDLHSNYRLALFEPRAPPPSSTTGLGRRTIALPGMAGVIRYSVLEGDLRLELAGVTTLTRGDILIVPSVQYRFDDANALIVGATYITGKSDSYGGAYTSNDQVFIKYQWTY
jgi:hypothetical protein